MFVMIVTVPLAAPSAYQQGDPIHCYFLCCCLSDYTPKYTKKQNDCGFRPFGTHARWMFNRYSHVPLPGNPLLVSVAEAMEAAVAGANSGGTVTSTAGCTDVDTTTACKSINETAVAEAEAAADVLIYCVGTGEPIESETSNDGVGATLELPGRSKLKLHCRALFSKQPRFPILCDLTRCVCIWYGMVLGCKTCFEPNETLCVNFLVFVLSLHFYFIYLFFLRRTGGSHPIRDQNRQEGDRGAVHVVP